MTTLFIFVFLAPIIIISLNRYSVYRESFKKNGVLELEARKTHDNRGLKFTKGKIYTFYKNEDRLMLNTDDEGYRDNYVFYKEDLLDGFKPTDLYSKFIFDRVVNYYS